MLLIIGTFSMVLLLLVLGFIGEMISAMFSSQSDVTETLSYEDNEAEYSTY